MKGGRGLRDMPNFLKQHRDVLLYVLFGALTTAVNYCVYLPLYHGARWSAGLCNAIAWAISVMFAFVTNKAFVFASHDWSLPVLTREVATFVGCRIASGLLETGILLVAVDWLDGDGTFWKLLTSVVVIVFNYAGSKLLIFRKK